MSLIKSLWLEKLRPNLHEIRSWSLNSGDSCKLIYAPSGTGFNGVEEMKSFCSTNPGHIFNTSEGIQSVNCYIDEINGKVFDEFVLNWTQKTSRMEWMLPGDLYDLPLQKYRLNFVISGEIDVLEGTLKSVRVYWDQASLLLQSGILMRSMRSLVRPGSSEALENALTLLPISNDYRMLLGEKRVQGDVGGKFAIGALNNITSILIELPKSTSGPAVSTPQRPTRSRTLNPALMNTLKFDNDLPFDSPVPANVRSVKSRNIFFDEENSSNESVSKKEDNLFEKVHQNSKYNPTLNLNENYIQQYESKIFSAASPTKKSSNLPQTDKILFESHVFDTKDEADKAKHVATAPPQCPSHILSPEEALNYEREPVSATLSRPGMMGQLRGASLSTTETNKFIPSTAIRFDPNRSQIVLGDENDDSLFNRQNQQQQSTTRKSTHDPNRSQIILGDY